MIGQNRRVGLRARMHTLLVPLTAMLAAAGCVKPPDGGAHPLAFCAIVYETQLPADRDEQLDTGRLGALAAEGGDVGQALAKIGPTRPIYRVYQPIGPETDCRITLAIRAPRVTASRRSAVGGRRINMVAYEQLGVNLKLFVQPVAEQPADGKLHVRLNAEMAAAAPKVDAPGPRRRRPRSRAIEMTFDGPADPGVPFVIVGRPRSDSDDDASAAYVCRVVLASRPAAARPPATPPAGQAATKGHLHGTLHRLLLPADQVGQLDLAALAAAAGGAGPDAKLPGAGEMELLFEAEDDVSLTEQSAVEAVASRPVVVGSRGTPDGKRVDTVRNQKVGAMFRIDADPNADASARRVRGRFDNEWNDMTDSDVEIGGDIRAPVSRTGGLTYHGEIDVGGELVTVIIASASDEKDGAVAYVCRAVLSDLR